MVALYPGLGHKTTHVVTKKLKTGSLVAYGRVGQLGPILRGQLIAWGRRPWAALRLNSFIRNP